MILAAESTAINEGVNEKRDSVNPPASSSSRVGLSDQRTTDDEKNTSISGEGGDIWLNEELVSRLDSLRAILVGEGAHEGKLLDTLESKLFLHLTSLILSGNRPFFSYVGELQNMLLLIRRSRKRPSRD